MYIKENNNKPKYLKEDKVVSFIDQISNIDLGEKVEIIKEKGMEGLV